MPSIAVDPARAGRPCRGRLLAQPGERVPSRAQAGQRGRFRFLGRDDLELQAQIGDAHASNLRGAAFVRRQWPENGRQWSPGRDCPALSAAQR